MYPYNNNNTVIILVMMMMMVEITNSIWPPPYKVDLHHEETFIIGDSEDAEDGEYDISDEIIINENDVKMIHLPRLHRLVEQRRSNKTESSAAINNNDFFINEPKNDFYFNVINSEPFEAGFLNDNNQEKRREISEEINYKYDELNNEYENDVLKLMHNYNTFNASNMKEEEESVGEALNQITDFKSAPRNCTEEQLGGIGFGAIQCIWIELKNGNENKMKLLKRLKRICIIWFCIYLCVAIPCWCQKGWCCCCCFTCKLCKPRKRIDEAKKHLLDNPPGTIINEKMENALHYQATVYETEAYNQLKKSLMNI